jgi:hypothetical protein
MGTKLATQSEYLKGTIILASSIHFNSFSIMDIIIGLNFLIFFLNGLEPAFRGILCWMMSISNDLKSSYDNEKILAKFS